MKKQADFCHDDKDYLEERDVMDFTLSSNSGQANEQLSKFCDDIFDDEIQDQYQVFEYWDDPLMLVIQRT